MPALFSFSVDPALFKAIRSGLVKRKVSVKAPNGQLSLADRWVSPGSPFAPQTSNRHALQEHRVAHIEKFGVESARHQGKRHGEDATLYEQMAKDAHVKGDTKNHENFAQTAREHREKQSQWHRAADEYEARNAPKPKASPKPSRKDTLTGSLFGEAELPKFTPKDRPGKPAPKPDAHQTPSGKKFTLHPRQVPAIAGGGTVYDAHDEDGNRDISVPALSTSAATKAHLDTHYHADYGKASGPDKAEQLARAKTVIDNPKTGDSLREKLLGEFPELREKSSEGALPQNGGRSIAQLQALPSVQKQMENSHGGVQEALPWQSDPANHEDGVYHHVHGGAPGEAGVGPALYLGRDQKALKKFYDIDEENKPISSYKGDPKWLDLTDTDDYNRFEKEAVAKHGQLPENEHMKRHALAHGFDGIRYHDPSATGEEFALYNADKVKESDDGHDKIGVDEAHHYENGKRVRGEGDEDASADTPARAIDSLAAHRAHMSDLVDGKADAQTHKAAFDSIQQNKEPILAELRAKTKAELDKISPPMWSGRKKEEAVKAAWETIAGHYNLDNSLSWTMGQETADEALKRHVAKVTDEDITGYRERRAQAIEKHNQRVEEYRKALSNPETKEEFDTFARVKGEDNLTPEQREQYDELRGLARRDAKREDATKEVAQNLASDQGDGAAGSDAGLKLVKHFHTKMGHDVHIATLDQKVEREHFDRLAALAKAHGGWYSRPWKGSPTGFAFKTEDAANAFMASASPSGESEGSAVEASEKTSAQTPGAPAMSAQEIVEARERDRQIAAAANLRSVADNLHGKAQEKLDAERKVNTARRASMAANAEEGAERDQQIAATMYSIASDLEEGKSTHLAGVQHKTHVETLSRILHDAKYRQATRLRDAGKPGEARDVQEKSPSREAIEHACLPHPHLHHTSIESMIATARRVKLSGTARAAAKIKAAGALTQFLFLLF